MSDFISKSRIEYRKGALDERSVAASPIEQFGVWFEDAAREDEANEPNACALATVGLDGQPSVRMVLLKGFDSRGFVFYTHYSSQKGRQLADNPRAALCFYWASLERQVRIEGHVEHLSEEESDRYFYSRPRESQFGSAVSRQSEVAESREAIEKSLQDLKQRVADAPVPRPASWGGFRIRPTRMEFWQGRENRLHDRVLYTPSAAGLWKVERLWP